MATDDRNPAVERRAKPRRAEDHTITALVQALIRDPKAAAAHIQVQIWMGIPESAAGGLFDVAASIGRRRGIDLDPAIAHTREILFQRGHAV